MRKRLIIALVFLIILLAGCGQIVESLKNEVSDENEVNSETVKTSPDTETKTETKNEGKTETKDDDSTETAEVNEIEEEAKESSNIEHYVYFDDEKMENFKKAFKEKDYFFDPFRSEVDNEPIVYVYDTHYKDYNLTINEALYFLDHTQYGFMVRDSKVNYVFPDEFEGTLITVEEMRFLDNLLAFHTNGCPIGDYNVDEVKKINEPTEENFKATEEVIKKVFGSSEALVQQTLESINHCYREVMGYSNNNANYDFWKLTSQEIKEGILAAKMLIDSKEDYIFDIESMKADPPYGFAQFELILRTNDDLIANKNKQTYIEYLKEDIVTFFPYIKEYIKWSDETVYEHHTINDEDLYNAYIESYDLSLAQLKAEEEYLLEVAERMKANDLGGLLQF